MDQLQTRAEKCCAMPLKWEFDFADELRTMSVEN